MDVDLRQRLGIFSIRANDSYLDQVAKLIPGESVAGFLFLKNYIGKYGETDPTLFWVPIVVGLGICIFVRGVMSATSPRNWNFPLLGVSLFAFVIWAANIIAGPFQGELWKLLANGGLVVMSMIGPEIYKRCGGTKSR